MFKLQRLSKHSSISRERVDFRFSNFQVLQVPKGWDKLLMSIVSGETGKTIAKLGKVLVRNGSCQWPENLLESVWISQDNSSKETSDCYFKFVVSSGAAKSGILGEVTLNMVQYMSSGVSASVSFPLKRCNYGTVFQVKIHCLAPTTKLRVKETKYSEPRREDEDLEYRDAASVSNGSENSFSGSVDSSSSQNRGKFNNKARSNCSVSSSNRSFDHVEGFDSKALTPRENMQSNGDELAVSSNKILGSSKKLLETAEGTIEELRAEAKMWERNARKLMLDLDMMSKEFSDQSKKQADLVMELSAAYSEHESLKKEIENLKVKSLDDSIMLQSDGICHIQKELEKEIKYQQESNANLASQLKRSQESNLELVTILQEMEETIEQQRTEIENLSTLCLKLNDMEKSTEGEINIQILEKALEDKKRELEDERYRDCQSRLEIEREYKSQLSVKEEEIARLKAQLSEPHTGAHDVDNDKDLVKEVESLREKVEELERDCNELTDENLELLFKLKESSNNNHISRCASFKSTSTELPGAYLSNESEVNDEEAHRHSMELNRNGISEDTNNPELMKQLEMVSHQMQQKSYIITESQMKLENYNLMVQEYEDSKEKFETDGWKLRQELSERVAEIQELKSNWLMEKQENELLIEREKKLQAEVSDLQEKLETVSREGDITSKSLKNLKNEIATLRRNLDSRVSEKMVFEEKMENEIRELENQFSESKEENVQLKVQKMDLIEERNILRNSNVELTQKNLELLDCCARIETLLNESQRRVFDFSKRVEAMEENLSSRMEGFSSEERSLKLRLDALQEANLSSEISAALQNLQLEVENLNKQISMMHEEKDRRERDLHEADGKVKLAESELDKFRVDSETRIQGLIIELASMKQSHEPLVDEHKKMSTLLESYKTCEEKMKTAINELELKLTMSDHEREQLIEQITTMKIQLQKLPEVQEEVMVLESELTECKFEKGKLEAKLQQISRDHDDLMAEKISYIRKIASLEEAISEFENCRKKGIGLEEKLPHTKADLDAKDDDEKSMVDVEVVTKETYERTKSSLEMELRELRERYSEMSLQYAEVEAEREDLVMKLRAAKSGKRWFS